MYRDVMAVTKSYYRLSMVVPFLRVEYLYGDVKKLFVVQRGVATPDLCKPMRSDNNLIFGALLAANPITIYLDLRRRGLDVSAVRYEDLVARPLDMCRVVLEFCHLPVSLAELAVKAFDVDSQANSIVAKSAIGHFEEPKLTPQIKTKLNEILEKCGFPPVGEPIIVEGTLSC